MKSKKNILFVTRTMNLGGTEKVILDLCRNLIGTVFDNIYVCSNGGINVPKLEQLGIKHFQIPDISTKNPIKLFKAKKIIEKIVIKNDIKIIHTHHRMAAFLCKGFKKIILINNVHNTFFDKPALTRIALKHYLNITVGSSVYKNVTEYYGIPKNKVRLIENSIDNKYEFTPIPYYQSNVNDRIITISYVGRLAEQKGLDILLKALNLMKKSALEKIRVYIYGLGEQEKELNYFIQKNELKNVFLKGLTSNPLNILANSDYSILPSRWEGLPLNIIESLAVGTPVICSDIENNTELIHNKIEGLTFQNGNENSLKNLLENLIFPTNEMKAKAKECYENKHSFESYICKYKEIYQRYLNDKI